MGELINENENKNENEDDPEEDASTCIQEQEDNKKPVEETPELEVVLENTATSMATTSSNSIPICEETERSSLSSSPIMLCYHTNPIITAPSSVSSVSSSIQEDSIQNQRNRRLRKKALIGRLLTTHTSSRKSWKKMLVSSSVSLPKKKRLSRSTSTTTAIGCANTNYSADHNTTTNNSNSNSNNYSNSDSESDNTDARNATNKKGSSSDGCSISVITETNSTQFCKNQEEAKEVNDQKRTTDPALATTATTKQKNDGWMLL